MISHIDRVFDIAVHPEKCVGCLICQLRCSMRFTDSFNPSRAKIIINMASDMLGAEIIFTGECDLCGICARNCPYGALEIKRKEGIVNE
jgi:electron transport complex protein RnfB